MNPQLDELVAERAAARPTDPQERARLRIQQLMEKAQSSGASVAERALARAIAQEVAARAGLTVRDVAELMEPRISRAVEVRRTEWRDVLARLVARAQRIEHGLYPNRIHFGGVQSAVNSAIRLFRAADLTVIHEGARAVREGGPASAGPMLWELWEAAVAEALLPLLTVKAPRTVGRQQPAPPAVGRTIRRWPAASPYREDDEEFADDDVEFEGEGPLGMADVLRAMGAAERHWTIVGQLGFQEAAPPPLPASSLPKTQAFIEERRQKGRPLDVDRLLAGVTTAAKAVVAKLRFKEVRLLLGCQTCEATTREAARALREAKGLTGVQETARRAQQVAVTRTEQDLRQRLQVVEETAQRAQREVVRLREENGTVGRLREERTEALTARNEAQAARNEMQERVEALEAELATARAKIVELDPPPPPPSDKPFDLLEID